MFRGRKLPRQSHKAKYLFSGNLSFYIITSNAATFFSISLHCLFVFYFFIHGIYSKLCWQLWGFRVLKLKCIILSYLSSLDKSSGRAKHDFPCFVYAAGSFCRWLFAISSQSNAGVWSRVRFFCHWNKSSHIQFKLKASDTSYYLEKLLGNTFACLVLCRSKCLALLPPQYDEIISLLHIRNMAQRNLQS